jgi:2-polyprenyl-6-methoxyphenol hydroxylase-like FAD-dependent oxidoreductase
VRLQHRVVDLLREGSRVTGVVAEQPDGTKVELRAPVVIGADGRSSTIASLVMGWTLGALFRGKFGVLRPVFRAGARSAAVKKELKRRQQLATPALPS